MGEFPELGNHLALDMKYRKKDSCWISPVLDMECGGEGGTGVSTQTYGAKTMEKFECGKC